MAKIIPITEHYQHFLAEMKESFWGDLYGETRLAWKRAVGSGVGVGAGPLRGARSLSAAGAAAAALPQRLLRAGFRDPDGHDPAAHRAHSGKKFSAAGAGAVSAARRGRGHADPGGVFARHLDPASGTGGGHADRRSGESADGVEADSRSGRRGETVSSGAVERRLRVFIFGRSEPAGAASGGAQAGADAGGLRGAARRHASSAGFFAQPGREPERTGKACSAISTGADWKASSSA